MQNLYDKYFDHLRYQFNQSLYQSLCQLLDQSIINFPSFDCLCVFDYLKLLFSPFHTFAFLTLISFLFRAILLKRYGVFRSNSRLKLKSCIGRNYRNSHCDIVTLFTSSRSIVCS